MDKIIESIYFEWVDHKRVIQDDEKEKYGQIDKQLKQLTNSYNFRNEILDILNEYVDIVEHYSFIEGLKVGIKLMNEVNNL